MRINNGILLSNRSNDVDTSEILFAFLFRYDEELAQSDLLNLPDPKSRSGTGITGFRGKDMRRPAATWK